MAISHQYVGRLILGLMVLALGPCASASPQTQKPSWQRSTLFFGRNIDDQEGVSEKAWLVFVDSSVSPRFPDGLTVLDGQGQYRESDQTPIIRERSKILLLVHQRDAESRGKIMEIIDLYKTRFKQNSVLWLEEKALVTFR